MKPSASKGVTGDGSAAIESTPVGSCSCVQRDSGQRAPSVYPSADIEREANRSGAERDALGNSSTKVSKMRPSSQALVLAVEPDSPADDAGFEAGCYLTSVDGFPLRDIIDWRWLSADDVMTVGYIDLDGDAGEVDLERDEGEDWGFAFEGVVFDGVKQCRNACTFCFMRQLPEGLRPSLTLRDDDFRLSFLAGTFVTLTNLKPEDEQRILEQRITPLRVSLHASNPQVRRVLIGRHAQHGLDALDRSLAQGIEAHAQIVLVPGENDGDVLEETLQWAYARPGILNIGIVPLGFTKYQSQFERSFNNASAAQAVLGAVEGFQQRALVERGTPWVFAADEFYRSAYGETLLENLPPASHYGDFSMFEDGIGIIRAHVDDWRAAQSCGLVDACAQALKQASGKVCFVAGYAMREHLSPLLQEGPLGGLVAPLYVQNKFFGGNVDVTGLLCGCDIVSAVGDVVSSCEQEAIPHFVVPAVIFNDDGLTLDGMSLEDMENAAGVPIAVVSCNPSKFLEEIAAFAPNAEPFHK